jgi:protein-disulfide isomerase
MLRKLAVGIVLGVVLGVALMAQTPAHLDTVKLEAYFRHLLVWPESVTVTIGTPEPISLPGFYKLKVEGTLSGKTQRETFYVSADSKTVIRGDVFNVNDSPFQADLDLLKTNDQPFLGIPGAPVTVVEFADFQCPYCRQEASVLRTDLMKAFPNDVQLFYLDYPLDPIHPFARGAAVMGRCIYAQNNDSFWGFHDWVFAQQSGLSAENFRDKAFEFARTDKKLDIAKLTSCATSPQPREEVDRTVAIGDALKISATPTLFINGRRLVGTIALDDLKMVVAQEIAWVKAQKKSDDCCSVQLSLPGMTPAAGKAAQQR